jgi:hypothetical protein
MENILIPQHISRQAFYSAQSFVLLSYLAYCLRFYKLSILSLCLYLSTLLHWNKVMRISVIKIVDIALTVTNVISVTFYDNGMFDDTHRLIWRRAMLVTTVAFVTNEIAFHISFSKTLPNTRERELVYYRSTYIHMLFLHLFQPATCAYCAIYSFTKKDSIYI